jgi:hypothetical protein
MPPDEVLCTEGKYINAWPKTQAEETRIMRRDPRDLQKNRSTAKVTRPSVCHSERSEGSIWRHTDFPQPVETGN